MRFLLSVLIGIGSLLSVASVSAQAPTHLGAETLAGGGSLGHTATLADGTSVHVNSTIGQSSPVLNSVGSQHFNLAGFWHTQQPAPLLCAGDCNRDAQVTVDEVLRGVNIALGLQAIEVCEPFDTDDNSLVTVNEIVAAVNMALNGCG